MFLHLSVCPQGGSTSVHAGKPPPKKQTPSLDQAPPPPGTRHSLDQAPLRTRHPAWGPGTPPRPDPPDQATPQTRHPPDTATAANGKHPTGKHSCFILYPLYCFCLASWCEYQIEYDWFNSQLSPMRNKRYQYQYLTQFSHLIVYHVTGDMRSRLKFWLPFSLKFYKVIRSVKIKLIVQNSLNMLSKYHSLSSNKKHY